QGPASGGDRTGQRATTGDDRKKSAGAENQASLSRDRDRPTANSRSRSTSRFGRRKSQFREDKVMRPVLIASCMLLCIFFTATSLQAGGPMVVGGPKFGTDAQPFTWDPHNMPIQYRLDPGPMAVKPSNATVIDNAAGLQRVQNMFAVWQSVPTATISFSNAGPILSAGAYVTGAYVATVPQFNDLMGSCQSGTQNPVMFDANGQIMSGLGLST